MYSLQKNLVIICDISICDYVLYVYDVEKSQLCIVIFDVEEKKKSFNNCKVCIVLQLKDLREEMWCVNIMCVRNL